MNKNKALIDKIFAGKLTNNQRGKIGIIFKGGNVYKLFTQIVSKQLEKRIFQNYCARTFGNR
jgi:hypothetical protein